MARCWSRRPQPRVQLWRGLRQAYGPGRTAMRGLFSCARHNPSNCDTLSWVEGPQGSVDYSGSGNRGVWVTTSRFSFGSRAAARGGRVAHSPPSGYARPLIPFCGERFTCRWLTSARARRADWQGRSRDRFGSSIGRQDWSR